MADFTPINTQEEFDEAIKARLAREKETVSKQYESQIKELNTKYEALSSEKTAFETTVNENAETIKGLEEKLKEAEGKVKTFELDQLKQKAALDAGVPIEFKNRLTGETEEEIKEDAKSLAELFKQHNNRNIPKFEPNEGVPANKEEARKGEFKKLVEKIQKGE